MNAVGHGASSVPYNAADQSGYFGVALVPGTRSGSSTTLSGLAQAGVPYVKSGECFDPGLTPDLNFAAPTGLCYHHGLVLSRSETFALTWDPLRRYWSGTRSYVEQFLRDVADANGTLTSPYAVTPQYKDSSLASAGKGSEYGGACIDYGNLNQWPNKSTTCLFGSSVQTGPGYNYPANGCVPAGASFTYAGGAMDPFTPNDICLTDAQIRSELSTIVSQMGIINRTQPGYTPLVVLPLPPGIEACLTSQTGSGGLCSANGSFTPPPAPDVTMSSAGGVQTPFTDRVEITYVTASGESMTSSPQSITVDKANATVTVASPPPASGATGWYAYVSHNSGPFLRVQSTPSAIGTAFQWDGSAATGPVPPASAYFCSYHSHTTIDGQDVAYIVQPWTAMTQCDEPDAPPIQPNPPPAALSTAIGIRLVSPISQAELGAIVDPEFDGWFAQDGTEINDHGGCVPEAGGLDNATVGTSPQNPYLLQHEFNNAAVMESDPFTYGGCAPNVVLAARFVVPSPIDQGEVVGFDGSTTASTLIVPNQDYAWSFGDGTTATGASVVHSFANAGYYDVTLTVTDRGGNVQSLTQRVEVLQADGQPPAGGGGGGSQQKLKVTLQLLPQSLRAVLRDGLAVRVHSNEAANGFAALSIFRGAAHRAHLSAAGNPDSQVVIGRGTVSAIKNGTVTLRVRISSSTAGKLAHAGQLTLTLDLRLLARNGARATARAVGRYRQPGRP
jgi:hypothetical protein